MRLGRRLFASEAVSEPSDTNAKASSWEALAWGSRVHRECQEASAAVAKGSYLDIRFYLDTTPRQSRVQEAGCEKRDCARATTGEQGL